MQIPILRRTGSNSSVTPWCLMENNIAKERETNLYWKKILDTMNDGLMLVGTDGTILEINGAFTRLTGYYSNDIVGRRCTLLRCDACEITLENGDGAWCTLFKRGQDVRKRCIVTKKDGTYLPTLKNASLLKNEHGRHLGAVETLTDISEIDRLDNEVDQLSRHFDESSGFYGILGKAALIEALKESGEINPRPLASSALAG